MNLPGARRRGTTSCEEEIENYAKRNSTVFITRDYTIIKLTRLTFLLLSYLADLTLNKAWVILLSQLLTNDGTTLCGIPVNLWLDAYRSVFAQLMLDAWSEARKTAPLLVRSSIATTPCRKVTAAYALNYLELRPASPWFLNSAIAAIIARAFYNNGKWGIGFLSANMMALVGTVLYNAIKEYYDDGMRKTIYFYGYTVEDNYNAICEKWKRLSEIRHDYHDNDVDDILMKWKREDNILTVDECRTGHSNEEDIEADEREEETRVRLRESSGEIHDILLREFCGADDFTESVTHNDDEQEYTIDNRIVYALALTKDEWELELEDCDALVERYEEEINCSDLYSTV
ncbi:hypothetical protein HBI17_236100 [Parastagonospora nodorum]|nr:hypothetical protein HBI17_236100 [Parastagonospora nodorum]